MFDEMVTTYDGTTASRRDCRFIKGEYFIKDKQCFFMEGQWYRITSPAIAYDNYSEAYVIKKNVSLDYGVVGIRPNDTVDLGYFRRFSRGLEPAEFFYLGTTYIIMDIKRIERHPSVRESLTGIYYIHNDPTVPRSFFEKVKPNKDSFYPFRLEYGSEYLIESTERAMLKNPLKDVEILSNASRYLTGYTYGVEFESSVGAIPLKHLAPNGLIPCRDGSITGFEYTTTPLSGEQGIKVIKNACKILNKYCGFSPNESLHIHIGGYPRDIKAIVGLYKVVVALEREIYSLFPYYYADTSKFKRKGYCNPMPKVEMESVNYAKVFESLYYELSGRNEMFVSLPNVHHPMDRSGQHKWDVSPRYYLCNMIPIIWKGKGTVEFRCHLPTFSDVKVINWLFITTAILRYARKYTNDIIVIPSNTYKLSLETVLNEIYPKAVATELMFYISQRKDHYSGKNDPIGELEIRKEQDSSPLFILNPIV